VAYHEKASSEAIKLTGGLRIGSCDWQKETHYVSLDADRVLNYFVCARIILT
jgi:hypothetical protein